MALTAILSTFSSDFYKPNIATDSVIISKSILLLDNYGTLKEKKRENGKIPLSLFCFLILHGHSDLCSLFLPTPSNIETDQNNNSLILYGVAPLFEEPRIEEDDNCPSLISSSFDDVTPFCYYSEIVLESYMDGTADSSWSDSDGTIFPNFFNAGSPYTNHNVKSKILRSENKIVVEKECESGYM